MYSFIYTLYMCVCVYACGEHDNVALWMFFALLEVCHFMCTVLFLILMMNFVYSRHNFFTLTKKQISFHFFFCRSRKCWEA